MAGMSPQAKGKKKGYTPPRGRGVGMPRPV